MLVDERDGIGALAVDEVVHVLGGLAFGPGDSG